MNIIAWDKDTNAAIEPSRLPVDGELAKFTNGNFIEFKTWYEPVVEVVDTEAIEMDWAMSELSRTDELAKLLDYPHKDKLYEYRQELRDYAFDGNRPSQRLTPKGALI